MAHIPHLLVPGPWSGDRIDVSLAQQRHVSKVLRREHGSPISYTDGSGVLGEGTWEDSAILRGQEVSTPAPPATLTVAVAPPESKERVRWLVEKCTELGVGRIRWLATEFGHGRPPRSDKSAAWMEAALEQSRRTRITIVDDGWSGFADLGTYVVADSDGERFDPAGPITIAIGPEGGWAPSEVTTARRVSLAATVLRTETAAVAAAAIFGASTRPT